MIRTTVYGPDVLARVAAELIQDPRVSYRVLANAVWGPEATSRRAKEAVRRLRAGNVPPGVDKDLLAAVLSQRTRRCWNRDSVLQALRSLAASLGRTPRECDVKETGTPDAGTCCRLFGSWNNALRAAGLPVNRASPAFAWRRRADARQEIIRALRDAADLAGGAPSVALYEELRCSLARRDWPSASTVRGVFGRWSAALRAAEIDSRPHVQRVRPEQAVRAACAADAVSGAALRGFAVPGDFAGMPKGTALRARVELARRGVPVVTVRRNMAGLLAEAASRGWPEVPGKERGREYALRLARGETMRAIGRSVGLTRERVRQLAVGYLVRARDGRL